MKEEKNDGLTDGDHPIKKGNKDTTMADVYEVIRAIHQAASNGFAGALDDKGEPREDMPIDTDGKNEGFRVSLAGNILKVKYLARENLQEIDEKYENKVDQKIEDIVSFLKKEYRKDLGESLSLKRTKNFKCMIQPTGTSGNGQAEVSAYRDYEVESLKDIANKDWKGKTPPERINESIRHMILEGHTSCLVNEDECEDIYEFVINHAAVSNGPTMEQIVERMDNMPTSDVKATVARLIKESRVVIRSEEGEKRYYAKD